MSLLRSLSQYYQIPTQNIRHVGQDPDLHYPVLLREIIAHLDEFDDPSGFVLNHEVVFTANGRIEGNLSPYPLTLPDIFRVILLPEVRTVCHDSIF